MRRIAAVVVLVLVVGGVAWALWPATNWPTSFCAPVNRVVGVDAKAIAVNFAHPELTLTATQQDQVDKMVYDITLALGSVPTTQLRNELEAYRAELGVVLSTTIVTDAMSDFDRHARTQLAACGVRPVGA
ncbi:MAG: hypothetical protein WCF25_10625 [Acidimicrobiales bacterium]